MRAVVLVGGEGTRLRPLTETVPKPLIPLVDRPFLHHVLDHLAAYGVDEAVLSSPYLGEKFEAFVRERGERGDRPALRWIREERPLGTGGAVANAARALGETFLVLNGDILTDLDLSALLAAHRARGAVATITLTPVEDARPYGLVALGSGDRLLEFREKPAEPVPGAVNAGTYVLEPEAMAGVPPGRAVSIEREVFPALIARGAPVFGFVSDAYWMDLGTPEKYLRATFDALEGRVRGLTYVAPFVGPGAEVSLRSHLGRWVAVGPAARVGDDALVEDSVLLGGATVGERVKIRDSILGPGSSVGDDVVLEGAVLAEGATVGAGAHPPAGVRVGAGRTYPD